MTTATTITTRDKLDKAIEYMRTQPDAKSMLIERLNGLIGNDEQLDLLRQLAIESGTYSADAIDKMISLAAGARELGLKIILSDHQVDLEDGKTDIYEISTVGKTYPVKEQLKAAGYHWNGVTWVKRVCIDRQAA